MQRVISTLLVAVLAVAFALDHQSGFFDKDTDAIVIEAASSADFDDVQGRSGRQFFAYRPPALVYPQHPLMGVLGLRTQKQPVVVPAVPVRTIQQQVNPDPMGRPCRTKDGRYGVCTTFRECYPYLKTFNFTDEESWVMGSENRCGVEVDGVVKLTGFCCSDEPEKVEEDQVAGEEVEPDDPFFGSFPVEFSEVNVNCGKRPGYNNVIRIVNGEEASLHEYPFMAAMVNSGRQFCGGTLIDEIHILTAAHCVVHMNKYDVKKLQVVLGDHHLKKKDETRGDVYEFAVKRVIRHKNFDNSKLYNDVAILTLASPVTFTNNVQPICLETSNANTYEDETVHVAGWGTTSSGASKSSDVLRKVEVEVWDNQECDRSYGKKAPGRIQQSQVCANHRGNVVVGDSCAGDSGGPLFRCTSRNSGCNQLGIVSWGIGCARAEYPGVYTRVSALLPWIRKIVRKY